MERRKGMVGVARTYKRAYFWGFWLSIRGGVSVFCSSCPQSGNSSKQLGKARQESGMMLGKVSDFAPTHMNGLLLV